MLVVDDDPLCLKVIERMLKRCDYIVTTSQSSVQALELLRTNKEHQFDLVLSDVYMPDMDGFKLLEVIGLEIGLPVIMMSSNGETSVVFRGVTHGAVDFLIKPVRIEELRNLWQHVVRKSLHGPGHEKAHSEEDEESKHKVDKKRKESSQRSGREGDDGGQAASNAKKPRVTWSVEMHQQFVEAVNQLGIDKAVPKRILDLMKVDGLTRENVASHLQKYRLYLKRMQGISVPSSRNGKSCVRSDHSNGSMPSLHAPGAMPAMQPPGTMPHGMPPMGMMMPGMPGADVGPRPHPFPMMPMPAMAMPPGMLGAMPMMLPPGMGPHMMMGPMGPMMAGPGQMGPMGPPTQGNGADALGGSNGMSGATFTAMLASSAASAGAGPGMDTSPFAAQQVFAPAGVDGTLQPCIASSAAATPPMCNGAADGSSMLCAPGQTSMGSFITASGSGMGAGSSGAMMAGAGSIIASNPMGSAPSTGGMQQNDLAQLCSQLDVNGLAAGGLLGGMPAPLGAGGPGGLGPEPNQDDFFNFLLKDATGIE